MNFRKRIVIQGVIVAVALAAGLAARRLVFPGASVERASGDQTVLVSSPAELRTEKTSIQQPLATLSEEERHGLAEKWRGTFSSANPIRHQSQALLELLRGAATNDDFEELVGILNGLPGHHEAKDHQLLPVLELVFKRWAALDPEAAARAAPRLNNRRCQHEALRIAIAAWTQREGSAVLEKLRALPKGLASTYGPAIVFDQLALDNPQQALELARQSKDETIGSGKFAAVFRQWAERDPQAVAQWIEAQTAAGTTANNAELRDALRTFGERQPAQAWELAAKLPAGSSERRFAREQILSSWAGQDPDAVVAAVLALPTTQERTEALRELGMNSMLRNPSPREELLAKLPDDAARQAFLGGVATGIVRQGADGNFAEAARIALSLPANEERTELLRELGGYWGRHDAPAASQWLTTQPPGTERDTVIGEFVRSVFPSDPGAALTWAAAIADPGKRERRLSELLPKWIEKDAAATAAWLGANDRLSAGERSRWLERISVGAPKPVE